jgi:hypothetical protein
MNTASPSKSDRIRMLNDTFRSTFAGGRVYLTQSVDALPIETKARVILAVQTFNDFTKGNDPYDEHDFGSFEIDGEALFFKIDYYSPDTEVGSEDFADPAQTTRVLTIMRADEY